MSALISQGLWEVLETLKGFGQIFAHPFIKLAHSSSLYFIFIVAGLLIAFPYSRMIRKSPFRFLRKFLFPAHIYKSASFRTDLKAGLPVYLFTILVNPFALLSSFVLSATLVTQFLENMFGPVAPSDSGSGLILLYIISFLAADFAAFFVHWMFHKVPALWNFHRVHHSAETLTPLTAFARFHPVERMLAYVAEGCLVGMITGPGLYLLGRDDVAGWALVYGIIKVIFAGLEPFRHSHIWISYGPRLSFVLFSPCMHQIHHSVMLEHRDKNMGLMLSIWDYLFGTIYVPATHERFRLGISDEESGIRNPHTGLLSLLLEPFIRTFRMRSRPIAAEPAQDHG
jgi:sterol desaturase/sphingolipid hydroxylase (fatty acid hydroxylase superfamily)